MLQVRLRRSLEFRVIVALALVALGTKPSLAQPAPECLTILVEGASIIWQNVCDEPISVAYCSTGRPIWGKRCGEGGKINAYYTHLTKLKAGEKYTQSKDIRSAPCRGELNSWDLNGTFSSDASGSYDCSQPAGKSAAKSGKGDSATGKATRPYSDVATAAAATGPRACSLARGLFAPSDRSPQACECRSNANATVFVCKALGRGLDQTNPLGEVQADLKALLRDVSKCDPATDSRRCERVNGGSGRRS